MDGISYVEAKELTIEDYENFIVDEGFNPDQAIAATLEESVLMMKKSYKIYVSVIINLSILSLRQNFLPDYLQYNLKRLKKPSDLNKEEQSAYDVDMGILDQLLYEKEFVIDKDEEYMLRVNKLLE